MRVGRVACALALLECPPLDKDLDFFGAALFDASGAEVDMEHRCTKTSTVDLPSCWNAGARAAAVILRRHELFTEAQVNWNALAQGHAPGGAKRTMLRPRGGEVGVLGGA